MIRFAAAFALGLLISPLPAAAQVVEATRHLDWQVVQDVAGRCVASTSVGLRSDDSGLVTVTMLRDAADPTAAVMTARAPLGAALDHPLAVTWSSGQVAVGLDWQSCDDKTCLAMMPVPAVEMDRLKRRQRVYFAVRPLPGVTPLIVPVSLMGLTRAWNDVQACG